MASAYPSGVNVTVTFFDPHFLATLIQRWKGYVYFFDLIFPGVCLFKGVGLFWTLEHIALQRKILSFE